ncbi:DUF998 domain-containing protein [Myxococcus virescens]|uniref:DUF998 domain-containing protein n=1 Tax=Myxococcus virescens TaxID=83456 RepID=A0A511HGU6_9BACT|nr:DUF998 domain-containing protein [Myxococcus virescens]GEL71759.1 hypothetical protein MVI01_35430 [Myxococcus virescens]SDF05093.1 Protein of unknown function [Myxococcus virescens]
MSFWIVVAAVLTALLATVPPWWFARRRPGYSHLRNTISELGETGAPDALRVAWLAFAPLGLAVWVFVALLGGGLPEDAATGLILLSLLGVSYVGAAVFPCDAGAPFWGTWRNQIHNLVAAIGYFGAGAGLIELGRTFEDTAMLSNLAMLTAALGKGVLAGIFVLSFESPVRGLVQRLIEATVFGWMLLVGVWLVVAA